MTSAKIIEYAHQIPGLACKGSLHTERCGAIQDVLATVVDAVNNIAAIKAKTLGEKLAFLTSQAEASKDARTFLHASGGERACKLLHDLIVLPDDGCEMCLNTREIDSTISPGVKTKCPACAERQAAAS